MCIRDRGKKGAVKYTIPFFEVGKSITPAQDNLANIASEKLQKYMDSYFTKESVTEVEEVEVLAESLESLTF